VNLLGNQDLLWMYRQRDTLRHHGAATLLQVVLDGHSLSFNDSTSLLYLASLQATYPALDSIYSRVLQSETKTFAIQKDSLLAKVSALGWSMRYLQAVRNLQRQQQLIRSGRSQVLLSFHNFNLAADVGLYARRRYLRRSARYLRMGQMAKDLGIYWGGDFVGFPDPGHIQRFKNSAALVTKYPMLAFEFEKYRDHYEAIYRKNALHVEKVLDTEALLIVLNRLKVGKVCACQQAILPKEHQHLGDAARVEVNTDQNWVFIKPYQGNGYYYSLGRWTYQAKN
jgi:peptidoglycan L-alanyl-D-glutamate endopeptidase CwlK